MSLKTPTATEGKPIPVKSVVELYIQEIHNNSPDYENSSVFHGSD